MTNDDIRHKQGQPDVKKLSRDDPDQSYAVGYKKPPLDKRFKPGVSGNPNGRKQRTEPRDVFKAVQEVFMREIRVREGDNTRSIPRFIALIEKTVADAVQGDTKAKVLAYKMAQMFGIFRFRDDTRLDLASLTDEERAVVAQGMSLLRKAQVVLPDRTGITEAAATFDEKEALEKKR